MQIYVRRYLVGDFLAVRCRLISLIDLTRDRGRQEGSQFCQSINVENFAKPDEQKKNWIKD